MSMTTDTLPAPSEKSPIDSLRDQSNFSLERTPWIGPTLDSFADALGQSLSHWSILTLKVLTAKVESAQLLETLALYPDYVAASFGAQGQAHPVFALLSQQSIGALMSAAFGVGVDLTVGYPMPSVERALMAHFFDLVSQSINSTLLKNTERDVSFRDFSLVSEVKIKRQSENAIVSVRCEISSEFQSAILFVLVPVTFMHAIRQALQREPLKETQFADREWANEWKTGIEATCVTIEAVIDRVPMTLRAISRLHVGMTLELPTLDMEHAVLTCGGRSLFNCKVGQNDGYFTLHVNEHFGQ